MAFVTLREGESGDSLIKRFGTQVQKGGVLRQLRDKRYFHSKGEARRRKKARTIRRLNKKNARTNDYKR